jgi:hypothetical protein
MTDDTISMPPLSEVARLDAEISELMHRIGAGDAPGQDMDKVGSLIRERALASLPSDMAQRLRERDLIG